MSKKIGLLLPRSTDYPSIGFDIIEGLKLKAARINQEYILHTENTGFGENPSFTYSKAEKLFMQDEVDVLLCFSNAANAQEIYQLAAATGKIIIVLDTGMQFPEALPAENCYHISLQGAYGCYLSGKSAGEKAANVLMAVSFFDSGYAGPLAFTQGLKDAEVKGNYISPYKIADFNIDNYLAQLESLSKENDSLVIGAFFTSYLSELFFEKLKEHAPLSVQHPFFCSPFMAEEISLNKCVFPGGDFFAVVPWGTDLDNDANKEMQSAFREKNKSPNIFHLLGWEAATCVKQIFSGGSLQNFSYESPRGTVTMLPETRNTLAPMYHAKIIAGENGFCKLKTGTQINIDANEYENLLKSGLGEPFTGWKNNFFCI